MSLFQKSYVVEGDKEIWVEWRHQWKVPKEVNGYSEKTFLLLTEIFFVQMEDIPLNKQKFLWNDQMFFNKRRTWGGKI